MRTRWSWPPTIAKRNSLARFALPRPNHHLDDLALAPLGGDTGEFALILDRAFAYDEVVGFWHIVAASDKGLDIRIAVVRIHFQHRRIHAGK